MNEPKDSESSNEQNASSDASAARMPWHLPGEEGLALPDEEVQQTDEAIDEMSQGLGVEALTIWCPDCGQEMHISREHLGMQGACLNCYVPIVASMRPDENGSLRVKASKVGSSEGDSPVVAELVTGENSQGEMPENEIRELEVETTEEAVVEESVDLQQDVDPLLTEEAALETPLPAWMSKSLSDEKESQDEEGGLSVSLSEDESLDEEVSEDEEELKSEEVAPEIPLPSWMAKSSSDEEGSVEEEGDLSEPVADADEVGLDEEGGETEGLPELQDDADGSEDEQAPSWVKGGNPWDALGLNQRESDDEEEEDGEEDKKDVGALSEDEEDVEESQGFPSLLPEMKADEKTSEDESEDEREEKTGEKDAEEDEGEVNEDEESRLGLIIAAVIILLVGGGGLTVFLKPDLIRGKTAGERKAVVENSSSIKSDEKSKQDKPAIEKPAERETSDKKTADAGDMDKDGGAQSQAEKLAGSEPKAVERPQGQERKEVEASAGSASTVPQMATTRAEIHDGVALRMHQEGERTIRSFYRASSVEERSAFVLQPSKALEQMRAFYAKSGALPALRYVEFVGLVSDPTSGFRFGVFDVHEKENEASHRWSVVEVDPGRYAMDWGLYEQLEGGTLIAYLAKPKKDPKNFRLLMKLGESVLVQDSPWAEEAIKVYLQLPLASSGAETVLMKRSLAKKMGILGELAGGKMKIGQIELEWVAGDRDPGSKVPTITGFDGWGAWSKLKMRGLK